MIAFRIAGYAFTFVFWFLVAEYFGITGQFRMWLFVWTILAGAALGYYVVDHGIRIRGVPGFWRMALAVFICLLIPLYFCLAVDNAGSTVAGQPTSQQQGNGLFRMPLPKKPIVRSGNRVEADTGELEGVAAENIDAGFEKGRNETMDKIGNKVDAIARVVGVDPNTGRVTTVIQGSGRKLPVVVKTSEHTWEVKFHSPGTRVVETRFPLPLGKVYYVSTNGLVENLKVGKVVETKIGNGLTDKKFNFSPAPASEFCEDRPLMFRGITNAPNARLAFLTEHVPPGDYTIKIMEPLINPAEGEHSPGVPLDRWYQ